MRSALLLVPILFSLTAHAEKFPTWTEFRGYSVEQMKAVPDVRVADKVITEGSIKGKGIVEVVLMKNAIFAQKGFEFKVPYLKNYFLSRSWYKPGSFKPESLSKVERTNAGVLRGVLAKFSTHERTTASKKSKKNKKKKGHDYDDEIYGRERGYGYGDDGYQDEGYGYDDNGYANGSR